MDRIAQGDLSARSGSSRRDEMGALLRAIDRMQDGLLQLVDEVRRETGAPDGPPPGPAPRDSAAFGEMLARDLHERRRAERALLEARAHYRQLFELHPTPMWVVDVQSLRIKEANQAAVERYGWSRGQFLGMSVQDLNPREEQGRMRSVLQSVQGTRSVLRGMHHELRSGEQIDVEIVTNSVTWAQEAACVLVMSLDVTAQVRAEGTLRDQSRQLSELAQRLMTIEDTERKTLAQILHDRFGQSLVAIKLALERLACRRDAAGAFADARLAGRNGLAMPIASLEEAIADVRGLLTELRPPLLSEFGLHAALEQEVERFNALQDGRRVTLRCLHTAKDRWSHPRLDPTIEYALFMAAREALSNAVQHARADGIRVELHLGAGRAEIAVRDDGVGFEPHKKASAAGHLGLVGMRERMQWIGARLQIASRPGCGTSVAIEWPAKAEAPARGPALEELAI